MGETDKHHDLPTLAHRAAIWLLSAAVSVFSMVVWDNHNAVAKHNSLFDSVWNPDFRAKIEDDLDYPTVHETYRRVFVEQDAHFKEEVRRFMAAGSRFSRSDWEKGEAKLDVRISSISKRVRELEDKSGQFKFCETRYRELETRVAWLEAVLSGNGNGKGHTHE